MFGADHPVVHAQRVVNAVIDGETASFGAYRISPQPRISVLSDLRAVAGRVLAYATPQELQAVIPDDLRAAHFDAARHQVRRSGISGAGMKPGLAAPARAAATALGVIAALHALEKSDIAEAGDELRWLMTSSRARGSHVYPTNTAWGRGISPVLTGIQLAALGPTLNPCDQLRYRIGSALSGLSAGLLVVGANLVGVLGFNDILIVHGNQVEVRCATNCRNTRWCRLLPWPEAP